MIVQIDRSTGEILTANTLDREQTALFELTVTASDDGLSQNVCPQESLCVS